MQVMAIKCDRCGRVEEANRCVRVKLFTELYGYEQKEFDLYQLCADARCTEDIEFMGGR